MNTKRKKKIIVLAAVAIVTAALGIGLLLSPHFEREYVYAAQTSLLDDVMRNIQRVEEMPEQPGQAFDIAELPDADYTVDCMIAIYPVYEDYAEAETQADNSAYYEYEAAATYEPLPDNAFPSTINGIGILTIEAIDLQLPIAEGVDEATLRIAPGRVPQTAQIGEVGNAVIAGHRNYTFGSMFNRLGELDIGDIVLYQARNGELMEFVVFEVAVIEPHDQIAFLQPVNDSIITLYTCTPIRIASHRLIIRAQRIG